MQTPRPLIAGNWKMHGLGLAIEEARVIAGALDARPAAARVAICPPFTLISRMAEAMVGSFVAVGAQDCRPEPAGAFTGGVSAEMLADAGARLVIVGHSERRLEFGETDALIAAKAAAAFRAGLEPIVCVGENREQREAGQALDLVLAQVAGSLPGTAAGRDFAIAYEPIWAIGSGATPTCAEISEIHGAIRDLLGERFGAAGARAPILYGGSVKPANARDILAAPDVNGALIGGASLTAAEFLPILATV